MMGPLDDRLSDIVFAILGCGSALAELTDNSTVYLSLDRQELYFRVLCTQYDLSIV